MILILAIIYIFRSTATFASLLAQPTTSYIDLSISNTNATFSNSIQSILEARAQESCTCVPLRSTWDIVWSCLATIFACSWVSVHPNIPDPKESDLRVAVRRIELMFWAIIAPEMIILWAMRQWDSARRLAKMYKAHGWTKTHGFFIQMGGFMIEDERGNTTVLLPWDLEYLYNRKKINIPSISEKDIQDRSKANGLSKTIVLVQTTWFVAQCISRHIQHLAITQLELVTLALAVLNGAMYFLWWNKPLDVRSTITISMLKDPSAQQQATPVSDERSVWQCIKSFLVRQSHEAFGFPLQVIRKCSQMVSKVLLFCVVELRNFSAQEMFKQFQKFSQEVWEAPFARLFKMAREDMYHQTHVNTFYASDSTEDYFSYIQLSAGAIATVFGAIHLIGWTFLFPSHVESLLWRISSLIITSAFVWLAASYFLVMKLRDRYQDVAVGTVVLLSIAYSTLYIISRFILLIIACIQFRDLPLSAFQQVEWTSFFPHI